MLGIVEDVALKFLKVKKQHDDRITVFQNVNEKVKKGSM